MLKKVLFLAGVIVALASVSLLSPSCGSNRSKGPDTLKVNTTALGAGIIGFNGPTPVEISVCQGTITKIEVLPNQEGPRYLRMVEDSGLLGKLVGKTLEEARETPLDAVSGATYTSNALIKNIRLGLEEAGK